MRLRLAPWILSLVWAPTALASVIINTEWTPNRSRQGEPIRFTITVKTRSDDLIRSPEFPTVLADWDLVRTSLNPSMRTVVENGTFVVTQSNEYTYILAPRRKGKLAVPSVAIAIGTKRFRTQAQSIQVDDVPLGSGGFAQRPAKPVPMPTPRQPSVPDPNSPWGPGVPGLPREEDIYDSLLPTIPAPNALDFAIPGEGRQTFFVKAVVKKTNVFVGEMIEVSYRAYTKTNNLREPEITKFPEFKGFLKEDLYFPKIFDPQPVLIQGQPFFETELIRYALYPLREGSLSIDPMNFKLRISNRDVLADAIDGNSPFGNPALIPMEKSSPGVAVLAKPLPVPKPESFTGAVGNFAIELLAPPSTAQTGQPFAVSVNIEGQGNLKSTEAPKFNFPKGLEITNLATHPGSFNEDGSGSIRFEYLLTPTEAGTINVPEGEWSFFDPSKIEYRKLKLPAFTIAVSQGATSLAQTPNGENAPSKPRLWSTATLDLVGPPRAQSAISEPWLLASHPVFGIHLTSLAFFLAALWRRRRQQEREEFLQTYPWTKLEEDLLQNQKLPAGKVAEKIDQWMRLRLIGLLKSAAIDTTLHAESPRGDFTETLRQHLPADFHKLVEQLKQQWSDLDTLRFSGATANSEMATKAPFEKSQATLRPIEKALRKIEKKLYQGFQDEWSS